VKWDGRYVAGVSSVTVLKRTTDVIIHRDGGDPGRSRKLPGLTGYEAITLRRVVTRDTAFVDWANKLSGHEPPLGEFRKDIVIEVFNEAGQLALSFKVYRCWVSEYQAFENLDDDTGTLAIESITLENEGWERDPVVAECV
jgi:phage tail-like protein